MGMKSERTLTQLEWFTVPYRTVMSWAVWGVVILVAAGGFWYYQGYYAPRASAGSAIRQADEHLRRAEPLADAHGLSETIERASGALTEAREAYSARNFDDARFAALHSSDLSLQALEMADGNRANPRMVRFYGIEGDVRVKHAGGFSWESADLKTTLNIGDQVKTSSSASARLVYFDGTETTIQPGSLLEIRDLFEDPVTKVRRVRQKLNFGEVQASTPERNVRGSYHEVATEKVSARSEKAGEFRMTFNRETKTTVVDAFKGQIDVASGGSRESLQGGERIHARSDGQLGDKEALPGVPRLLAPAAERVFIFENPQDDKISLSWEQVPGAARYHLVISDKPLFTDPLHNARQAQTTAVVEAAQGSYHWKVAAINPAGIEGPFSQVRSFRVSSQRIRDRDDAVPPSLDISEFVTIGMMVIINGTCEPGATLWVDNEKVDVHDDGRFYAVVRLRKEGMNELRIRAQDTAGNETQMSRVAYVEMF